MLPRNTHPTPSPIERMPNKPDLVMLWEDGMVLKHQKSHLHPEKDNYQELVYKTPTTHRVTEKTQDTLNLLHLPPK